MKPDAVVDVDSAAEGGRAGRAATGRAMVAVANAASGLAAARARRRRGRGPMV
jgi:hypothetical protein